MQHGRHLGAPREHSVHKAIGGGEVEAAIWRKVLPWMGARMPGIDAPIAGGQNGRDAGARQRLSRTEHGDFGFGRTWLEGIDGAVAQIRGHQQVSGFIEDKIAGLEWGIAHDDGFPLRGVPAIDALPVSIHEIELTCGADGGAGDGEEAAGELVQGSGFTLDRSQVEPSVWRSTLLKMHFDGAIFFFKSISRSQHTVRTDFQPIPANLNLKQAVALSVPSAEP